MTYRKVAGTLMLMLFKPLFWVALIIGLFVLSGLMNFDLGKAVAALVLVTAGLALYFLPYLIALHRQHSNKQAILILNIFTGWTFIGWIVALVWANTNAPHG